MKITFDMSAVNALARDMNVEFSQRRINAAAATALTYTALDGKKAVEREMRAVLDRPNPYTMRQVRIESARADKLQAAVEWKDDYGYTVPYLLPQVEGGSRRAKRFEKALQAAGHLPQGWFAVPAPGARLDAFGNISRGQIIQILSQLRITLLAGTTRNLSFDARKQINAQRRAGGRFFVIKPGAKKQAGVYQREFYGRDVTPVLFFVRSVRYRQRLDFDGVVRREVAQRLPVHIERTVNDHLRRLLAKAGR
jgi:hypothetical protein